MSSLVPADIFFSVSEVFPQFIDLNTGTVKALTLYYFKLKITTADCASTLLQPHAASADSPALCAQHRWGETLSVIDFGTSAETVSPQPDTDG